MQKHKGNISVIVSFLIVVGLIVLAVRLIMNRPIANQANPLEGIDTKAVMDPNAGKEQQQGAPQQIQKQEPPSTQTKAMEQTAANGDTLSMNYTGRLTDGTVFDSNIDPKFKHVTPFEFKLGAGQVIQGWDEGLLGMKVGEKKTLTIPPEKAYGNRQVSSIPPNSTLIFEVELLAIKK